MLNKLLSVLVPFAKGFRDCKNTCKYFQMSYWEYVRYRLGINKYYYPVHKTCMISNSRKIYVGKNSYIGRPYSYFQGSGGIYIGDYTRIAMNVSVFSDNHDLYDHRKTIKKPVKIGDYCWIGTQTVIMAGVELGPRTIVAANSTVTKSFPQGYCVIGGCPAKLIKELNPDEVVEYKYKKDYYGFVPAKKFESVRKKYIDV